jgi:hypothetical protein
MLAIMAIFLRPLCLRLMGYNPKMEKPGFKSRVSGFFCSGRSPNKIRNHLSMVPLRCNKKNLLKVKSGCGPEIRALSKMRPSRSRHPERSVNLAALSSAAKWISLFGKSARQASFAN